ncbi:MAG: glycosyltransferase family 4 protein [Lentisphaerae bacterium]|nr:glycosyltransferase family 4 protein [Lentisphaerota bacterium]
MNVSAAKPRTAILHFAAPPAVGGVEEVIRAHAGAFTELGLPLAVVAGTGDAAALPEGVTWIEEPLLDTRHPDVAEVTAELGRGRIPGELTRLKQRIKERLEAVTASYPNLIVHNVLTVHVNFPLTTALHELLDEGRVRHCLAWCHDFSWTMPDYVDRLHEGYPWDLLKTRRRDVAYIVVSKRRREELARLLRCPADAIRVIYDGVDTRTLLGLGEQSYGLVRRFEAMSADLFILMPIRIVKSKNIEYALRTVHAIKKSGIRVRLVVTGPPDPHDPSSLRYYHELRSLRETLGLNADVHFVYEAGPDPEHPLTISAAVVGDLIRAADMLLITSHSEGFGMPVLEAGLAGRPVFTTDIPAAREIGGDNVMSIDPDRPAEHLARQVLDWADQSPLQRHRRAVRRDFTWRRIVEQEVVPLLHGRA